MSSDAIAAIKARLNIADVVRRYVDLRPVSGRWMGACPFHQETKPSFSVN
ncbi:MAG: CHC2 zinc finger domain-containing protein, partial [Desulfovibrionaceae bacterium]